MLFRFSIPAHISGLILRDARRKVVSLGNGVMAKYLSYKGKEMPLKEPNKIPGLKCKDWRGNPAA